jgi:hypothetical protein
MKATFEGVLTSDRFRMNSLYGAVWPLIEADQEFAPHLSAIAKIISTREFRSLANAILRNAFLIEPMLTRGGATKTQLRWIKALEGDQRFCSFEECREIALDLVGTLAEWIDDSEHLEALTLSLRHQMIPHEASFDYLTLIDTTDHNTRIHTRGNLGWICTPVTLRTLKLREFLTNPRTSPDATFFSTVLTDKIKIKAYLTDRVQTGEHQTNREKRWETHPHSVHFATREQGMAIEYKLVTQICSFDDFPEDAREALQAENILPAQLEIFRCPITLDALSFTRFRDELLNPVHGRSSFQVAHLNPLKLDDAASLARGHMAENISWMSADGNRIQGSMSLSDIRALLKRIAQNYEDVGLVE